MIFSIGDLSKKMIIPLLIPVIYIFRHYILEKVSSDSEKKSIFINTFIVSLSYIFNGILLLIEYNLMKSKEQSLQLDEFKNQLLIEKEKIEKKRTIKSFIFLILISFFNFFNFQIYDIAKMSQPSTYKQYYFYSLSITIFFLSTALMSYILLNKKIYRHQRLSLIISPILSIIMFSVFISEEGFELELMKYLFICLGLRTPRFILMVIGKFYMERYYVTPTKLLTFFGLFGLLFSLIANSISFFFEINDSNNEYINNGRFLNIFDYWGIMNQTCFYISVILWFIENYIIWFCISSFSPNHYIIYRNISSIIVIVKELIEDYGYKNYKIIISFFSLIGIFFCSLIYNEIIIIRILNLDKYTVIEIDKRQKEETENNNNNNFEIISNENEDNNNEHNE